MPSSPAAQNANPKTGAAHQARITYPADGVTQGLLQGWGSAQRTSEQQRRNHVALSLGVGGIAGGGLKTIASTRRTASLGSSSALVLYDVAGTWGYLGELYAMAVANLAGHFGTVSTEPVSSYTAGQINQYTATIYIGSTYYDLSTDQIPKAFYSDVWTSTTPVVWINDNIWNFGFIEGPYNFSLKYGWDPTNSYFAPNGSVGNVTQVTYKNETMTRAIPAGDDGGILHPYIPQGYYPPVTVLATAVDNSTSPATTFPWALRSGNLTYIGEIPFAYVSETDRVIALEDLLFDALAPNTLTQHRAMVRLEDLNANDDMTQLMAVAQYLAGAGIPYGFNVIPLYTDPLGYYNNGVPQTVTLAQASTFVSTINYMLAHGGTMVAEGYTHQYSNVKNPYTGVSGDDAEFFLASINSNNGVVWNGPIPGDSTAWALGRVNSSVAAFKSVNLPVPTLWVTPHYFATDVDYHAIATAFPTRYERSIYFNGILTGGAVNHNSYIGEFFPYVVQDVYGTKVIPENLGDYEPVSLNNNPIRLPANIINEAQINLAVRDGFASFFYDPSYGTTPLQQTIQGIQALGYTFVSPSSL